MEKSRTKTLFHKPLQKQKQ